MREMYYFFRQLTKPAYRIKGIGFGRLCEMVRRYAVQNAPATALQIDDFRGGAKFNCYLREHMGGQIFFRGSYSGDQLTLLELLLKEDSIFVDAGANHGEFSIAAARIARLGKVIAFEPVAQYQQRLLANIALNNFKQVQVMPLALGDVDGELPIYDQEAIYSDGTRHEGLPTLFASVSRDTAREVVAVRRLDDVLMEIKIARVDIMKFDIEGAEWIALRGAINTLVKYRPILILEIGRETCQAAGYEPQAFAQWIVGHGYRIEKICDGGKTEVITPAQLGDFQNIVAYPVNIT